VRSPPESRPLLPAPPLHSARTTPTRTHHHAEAHGQDGPSRDQLRHQPLRANTSHAGVPPGPAGSNACSARSFRSALPLRAGAQDRRTCCRCTRACARAVRCRACPNLRARREARQPPRDSTCARHLHVLARHLACFADGLRVAPPVQAAAAASGRARRPPRP
jgi:hypothetical protein